MADVQVNITGNDGLIELVMVSNLGNRQVVKTAQTGVSTPVSRAVMTELLNRHNAKLARARAGHDVQMDRST